MRTVPIVPMQPYGQFGGSVVRGRIGDGVGPFPESSLDEALGLAVGLGRIGLGPDMLEAEVSAGLGEGFRPVAGAVVGHDAGDGDAEACIIGDRRLEEGDGAFLLLVGQDLAEGDARGVVNADMDELPAGAARLALLWIAGDAVPDLAEATELLDVDVDHLAGVLALVAPDRFGRLDVLQPRQPGALQHPADSGGRDADLHGDVLAGQPPAAQCHDALGHRLSGHGRHDMGPGRAVDHAGPSLGLVALHPARHDLRRHTIRPRRMGFGKTAFNDRQRHFLSTQRREAGILVDVHSDPPVNAEAW